MSQEGAIVPVATDCPGCGRMLLARVRCSTGGADQHRGIRCAKCDRIGHASLDDDILLPEDDVPEVSADV